jgi:actin-related protein 8
LQTRRGSNVVVIHPGSRNLRIGKACDVNPVTIPNVIARKQKSPVPKPTYIEGVARPNTIRSKTQASSSTSPDADEYSVSVASDDPASLFFWILV